MSTETSSNQLNPLNNSSSAPSESRSAARKENKTNQRQNGKGSKRKKAQEQEQQEEKKGDDENKNEEPANRSIDEEKTSGSCNMPVCGDVLNAPQPKKKLKLFRSENREEKEEYGEGVEVEAQVRSKKRKVSRNSAENRALLQFDFTYKNVDKIWSTKAVESVKREREVEPITMPKPGMKSSYLKVPNAKEKLDAEIARRINGGENEGNLEPINWKEFINPKPLTSQRNLKRNRLVNSMIAAERYAEFVPVLLLFKRNLTPDPRSQKFDFPAFELEVHSSKDAVSELERDGTFLQRKVSEIHEHFKNVKYKPKAVQADRPEAPANSSSSSNN